MELQRTSIKLKFTQCHFGDGMNFLIVIDNQHMIRLANLFDGHIRFVFRKQKIIVHDAATPLVNAFACNIGLLNLSLPNLAGINGKRVLLQYNKVSPFTGFKRTE